MLDLKTVSQETASDNEGRIIALLNRDEEPYVDAAGNACTMTVLGAYATVVRQAQDANLRRMIKRRKATRSVEDLLEDRLNVAVVAVTAWSGIQAEGQSVPFSAASVRTLLAAAPWLLDQVEEAMRDHLGFSASGSKSS